MIRSSAYAELWGVVDGAVCDALTVHPDYLTPKGQRSARTSIVKRVTGTVLGFAAQAAKGRASTPAETQERAAFPAHAGEGVDAPSPHHCRIGRITIKRKASSRFLREFNYTTNKLRLELAARAEKRAGE